MIKRNLILLTFVCLNFSSANAQGNKYWIFFNDKDTSNYDCSKTLSQEAIKNRKEHGITLKQYSDIPVSKEYMNTLSTSLAVDVICYSKWLNGVSAFLSPSQKAAVERLSFVREVRAIDRRIVVTSTQVDVNPEYMHVAMIQMGLGDIIAAGLDGKGVNVGVIDAGFFMAQSDKYTAHMITEGKIKIQRDFIDPSRKDLITVSATGADGHGKTVLSMIGGYDEQAKVQFGMAPNASFYLARTENGDQEHRLEEDHWIMAMEWMDSLGVRLISTSLGYAINMDDPKDNYTQAQMNGSTASITKAAQIAYDEKGIFLTVSAGNEGANPAWRIISAPADAKGVLSVGATRDQYLDRIDYSSIGPEELPYLKPNVSCFSPNGTSFSCPAVAGFVACMMQKAPYLTNKELYDIIIRSGHLYPYGNNYIGYGVPQANKALAMIKDKDATFKTVYKTEVKSSKFSMKKLSKELKDVVVFNKKNETIVIDQQIIPVKKGKLVVKRKSGVARTTVTFPDKSVVEIIWN
jgi:subtilisin family serine protease